MHKPRSRSDQFLTDVLRLSQEPSCYFKERDIHGMLTAEPEKYFQFVKRALTDIAHGRGKIELPPKQIFKDPLSGGDFRVMPCVFSRDSMINKTVKLVGTNLRQKIVPDQITVGKAFVIHPAENFVSHIFEACLLSSARTGICAAMAIDLLGNNPTRMTVIGTGRVGYYSALYAAATQGIRHIQLVDLDLDRATAAQNSLHSFLDGLDIQVSKPPASIDTDVLILATTSKNPCCAPETTRASLIISLGADTDEQSELHPKWAPLADIFVDTRDSARYGDLKKWLAAGLVSEKEISDFFALIKNKPCFHEQKTSIFVSTGSALLDNLTIAYLLSQDSELEAPAA